MPRPMSYETEDCVLLDREDLRLSGVLGLPTTASRTNQEAQRPRPVSRVARPVVSRHAERSLPVGPTQDASPRRVGSAPSRRPAAHPLSARPSHQRGPGRQPAGEPSRRHAEGTHGRASAQGCGSRDAGGAVGQIQEILGGQAIGGVSVRRVRRQVPSQKRVRCPVLLAAMPRPGVLPSEASAV